ncbi:NrfD/PsrC family molybdoenzyme membrane anchor subunit [Stenotrophomonas sp. CC120223-11]|uniref:NrfD/PsrC family molybdoenzyme membrane anchor subunit n=1 Tax=Stenotrophomonas sp. CC120223-11 TaxID=1378090 RepID=UPI000ADBC7B4|nr:NrfD/PsrC family molybdoenzyme membrane anchor subunit [Stenotrophomonas sp. CC120223-11]CAD7854298.1 MAG: Sulfite reduction-associated complex DsrMKJOP protein DsrP (HmeB) [Olavius algarvensis Gamma 1 endosymbiont]SNY78397.1 prokaryotic molybdopterin-containing oxidoreductase family, membrane subunit [Stenotrophomonas sp. CC120223-11]
MKRTIYREWRLTPQHYWGLLAILAVIAGLGGLAFLYMEHEGHWVTGMSNQIVWGTPHVFAVFLIVAASGALNVASIGSVFGKTLYKPLARFSGLLAIALLAGGLMVLVLDLGRPDRLVVAMTTYNFRSIFAWNIFLYTGFLGLVIAYLWSMMERKGNPYTKPVGFFAFFWRLALTLGTGSIFGFLVSRQAYDTAIMAPLFIAMSFAYGLAIFILVLLFAFHRDNRPIGDSMLFRLRNLLGIFIGAVLFFVLAYFLTKLYGAKNYDLVAFYLLDGGIYTALFWFAWMLAGILFPLGILFHPALGKSRTWIASACGLVALGGLASIYVIIIGGQAYPMQLFPGKTILQSGFYDGVNGAVALYTPSLPELLLGIGGVAVALLITAVGIRMLQFLPESLADQDIDPHAAKA